jgi:hypothetical protein
LGKLVAYFSGLIHVSNPTNYINIHNRYQTCQTRLPIGDSVYNCYTITGVNKQDVLLNTYKYQLDLVANQYFHYKNYKMKFILSVTGLIAFVAAQPPPGALSLPQCGASVMVSAITAMKCTFTGRFDVHQLVFMILRSQKVDSGCICSKPEFKAALGQVSQKCAAPADKTAYKDFANKQCSGQPGFPIASI